MDSKEIIEALDKIASEIQDIGCSLFIILALLAVLLAIIALK